MNRNAPWLLLFAVLAVLVLGFIWLFRLRIAQGDVFPPYSTLRADPLGTRALHDSLQRLPGLKVDRRLKPISEIDPAPPRTIVLAGVTTDQWTRVESEDFRALDQAVRHGSRLVVALRPRIARTEEENERDTRREARRKREEERSSRQKADFVDLQLQWGVTVGERPVGDVVELALREGAVPDGVYLPEQLTWRSEAYLRLDDAAGWRVWYRRAGRPVLAERNHGRGTIVVATDAYFLSNEALQRERATGLLVWMLGSHQRVVFEEAHLGVVVQPGVAALARRYGLEGAFVTLLLLAVLFVWRRTALFIPPAETGAEVPLTYHPAAGLEALLRRSVPTKQLLTTCLDEWKPAVPPGRWAQAEAASAGAPAATSVVARYNIILRALRRR